MDLLTGSFRSKAWTNIGKCPFRIFTKQCGRNLIKTVWSFMTLGEDKIQFFSLIWHNSTFYWGSLHWNDQITKRSVWRDVRHVNSLETFAFEIKTFQLKTLLQSGKKENKKVHFCVENSIGVCVYLDIKTMDTCVHW